MALFVKELQLSRSSEGPEPVRRNDRVFHVWDDGGASVTPAIIRALYGTATTPDAMPNYGETFPGDSSIEATFDRISRVEGHRDLVQVTWEYQPPDGISISPEEELGYVDMGFDVLKTFAEAWRKKPGPLDGGPSLSIPANGDVANNNGNDIGGIPVDSGGEPGTAEKMQQVLRFSEIVDGLPDFEAISIAVGTRNSQSFYGAGIGRVLMLPIRSETIAVNKWRVNYEFVWDEFYHLIQTPHKEVNGKVRKTNQGSTLPAIAEKVYWRQPFPLKTNFNALSPNW